MWQTGTRPCIISKVDPIPALKRSVLPKDPFCSLSLHEHTRLDKGHKYRPKFHSLWCAAEINSIITPCQLHNIATLTTITLSFSHSQRHTRGSSMMAGGRNDFFLSFLSHNEITGQRLNTFFSLGNILISQLKGFHVLIKAQKREKINTETWTWYFHKNIMPWEFIWLCICSL